MKKKNKLIYQIGMGISALALLIGMFVWPIHERFLPMDAAALEAPAQQGTSIKSFGAVGDGKHDDTSALLKASKLTSGKIYFPKGTYVLSDSIVFHSKLVLVFDDQARIQVPSGKKLTINGTITAGLYKIFGGTGMVAGTATNKIVYPEWFGALGNAVQDDRLYIQAAVNYASSLNNDATVIFSPNKTYILGTMTEPGKTFIQMQPRVSLGGTGTVKVANKTGAYNNIFEFKKPVNNISITNLTIDSNSVKNAITVKPTDSYNARREFMMYTGSGVKIDNITVKNSSSLQTIMANVVGNMTITNNKFLNMGAGSTFYYDTSCMYLVGDNIVVAENLFEAGGPGANTAIEVHGSSKNVRNNTMNKYRTGILFAPTDNPRFENKDNIIAGNKITKTVFGINLWADTDDVGKLDIYNNNILVNARGGGYLPTNAGAAGIHFYNKGTYSWSDLTIRNNTINFENPGNGYMTLSPNAAGIDFSLYTSTANIKNVVIKGNTIRNAYTNGISWSVYGIQQNVTIEENTITNSGFLYSGKEGFSSGIAFINNNKFNNVVVRNNNISDDRTPAKMYTGLLLKSIGTADNASTDLYWTDNVITSSSPMLSGSKIITQGNTPVISNTPSNP